MTKGLAAAWATDNIQVNAVLPGWIDSELTQNARRIVDGLHDNVLRRTPAGRWGNIDDMAGIAAFLASTASDFVTGTAIPVDGGYAAPGLAMTPEDILSHAPRALTGLQRTAYFENGFVAVDGLVPPEWVQRLTARSNAFLEESRSLLESNEAFDLGPNHSAEQPHVRRLRATVDRHPEFWEFASESVFADVAADLVGPDVKFHSAKLNYKSPGAGEIVQWHQDIPAWPHTNYSPVTLGVYLDTVAPEHGPLMCIPGSHEARSSGMTIRTALGEA